MQDRAEIRERRERHLEMMQEERADARTRLEFIRVAAEALAVGWQEPLECALILYWAGVFQDWCHGISPERRQELDQQAKERAEQHARSTANRRLAAQRVKERKAGQHE